MRHIAAARFQRNQRLLQEVFNEVCIPDLRLNVNADRISTLRRQAHALKEHCETFEKDFTELEQKHVEKKRKFLEENENFYDDYKQASATDLSEEKINEIIQKHEAMEKLQKEKQLLIQQQQQTIPATTQAQLSTTSTTTISQPDTLVTSKAKHESINEIPSQQILTSESTPSLSSSIQTLLPELQSEASQISSSQSTATPSSTIQINESKIPSSQPVQTQVTPPVLQHTPSTSSSQLVSQVYPMMHTNSNHVSTSSYGHYQQGQYRPQMTQRPASYSANVQGQQQQQWSSNTYDSHYYNSYPSNVPWSQHQQQWPMNPSQQPTGTISQIHGPSQHSSQMYGNSVHYGNNSTNTTTWNSGSHSTQQYGYTQNSTYDPRFASVPPSLQMHNPSSSYDYTSSSQ
ncbi:hypothetical protein I4U23_019328 [Adineta vaga]|nr:hypothetical protein I4U23_019328 [Adineta vaga]